MNSTLHDRRPMQETATLGEAIYAGLTQSVFGPQDQLKYAAIAVDSGNYEIDADMHLAICRMKEHEPNADIWDVRIGEAAAVKIREIQ